MTIPRRRRLVVLGAGGHGCVVADTAQETGGWSDVVFLDDRYPDIDAVELGPILGKISDASKVLSAEDDAVVAIGRSEHRLQILDSLSDMPVRIATVIHPRACIGRHVKIEPGVVIFANVVVNCRTSIGRGCILNTASSVDHDCVLGEGVHVCPGAHLAGGVKVGARSWLGIGCAVREYLTIGADVIVGAGGVVVKDLAAGQRFVGNPARLVVAKAE